MHSCVVVPRCGPRAMLISDNVMDSFNVCPAPLLWHSAAAIYKGDSAYHCIALKPCIAAVSFGLPVHNQYHTRWTVSPVATEQPTLAHTNTYRHTVVSAGATARDSRRIQPHTHTHTYTQNRGKQPLPLSSVWYRASASVRCCLLLAGDTRGWERER